MNDERIDADNMYWRIEAEAARVEAASIWQARAAAAELRAEGQEDLLRRLYHWDVMSTVDGEYWRGEIAKYLAAPQSPLANRPDQMGPPLDAP